MATGFNLGNSAKIGLTILPLQGGGFPTAARWLLARGVHSPRPIRPSKPMIPDTSTEPCCRTGLLACVVLVMIGLAGCAGTGLGAPIGEPPPYTETRAALDGKDLRATHLDELEAAGSYRSTLELTIEGEAAAVQINRSGVVESETNESSSDARLNATAIDGEGLSVAAYSSGNVTYRRVVADVGRQTVTRYDAARTPYADPPLAVKPADPEVVAHASLIDPLVEDVNWTQRGVERHGGNWVTRYEAVGFENVSRLRAAAVDTDRVEKTKLPAMASHRAIEVSAVNATLLVGSDGIVRQFQVHVVGEIGDRSVELTLEGRRPTLSRRRSNGPAGSRKR